MPSALKFALEDLLKAERLAADGPPLGGEDRRGTPLDNPPQSRGKLERRSQNAEV